MGKFNKRKVSKYIAYLLRHDPSGLNMNKNGYVKTEELLKKLKERWPSILLEDLKKIDAKDRKGRYELNNDKIRALYGHSVQDVEIKLPRAEPNILYHGTTEKSAVKIINEGLKSKGRNKVHLSPNPEEAQKVGKRRANHPVILKIDAGKARKNGHVFRKANKFVYLSEDIPPSYITIFNNQENV